MRHLARHLAIVLVIAAISLGVVGGVFGSLAEGDQREAVAWVVVSVLLTGYLWGRLTR